MLNPKVIHSFLLSSALGLGWSVASAQASPDPRTVMLVPQSASLIRLCGDVNALFPEQTLLAVYTRRGPLALRVFNVWDARSGQWRRLSPDAWHQGTRLPPGLKRLLVIAPESAIEEDILRPVDWSRVMLRISDSDLSMVANRLDALFGFTPEQWRFLADRNGLVLQDRHAEQRRYGRFGPPGGAGRRAPTEPRRLPDRAPPVPAPDPDPPVVAVEPKMETSRPPTDLPVLESKDRRTPLTVERTPTPESPSDVGVKPDPEPASVQPKPPPALDEALRMPAEMGVPNGLERK